MSIEIPKEIIELLNRAAGKEHSKDGTVLTTLNQILQLADTLKEGKDSLTTLLGSRQSKLVTERPGWDEYFLNIAEVVATRGDCKRAQHGAVIVKNHRIVSTGYNGSEPGGLSCLAGDCPRAEANTKPHYQPDYSDCIALHAEQNAIAYAGYPETNGSTIYITGQPCDMCSKLIKAAGVVRVVYDDSRDRGSPGRIQTKTSES